MICTSYKALSSSLRVKALSSNKLLLLLLLDLKDYYRELLPDLYPAITFLLKWDACDLTDFGVPEIDYLFGGFYNIKLGFLLIYFSPDKL